jgi:type IV secretion system protein VirD4
VLTTEPGQSLAVVGPSQSGKTTALAIPAILGWPGPVLAASVKVDLLAATIAWRRRCGTTWCFDPTGATGRPADRWTPIDGARSWLGARRMAADLVGAARGEGTTADGEFWYATAAKLLAPLLFAAAVGGREMHDVVRWVDTQEVDEVADILAAAGVAAAHDAAMASWQRDERQRSSVYTTAETVLEPYAEMVVPGPEAAPPQAIDTARLLSGSHTLYLCAPAHDQRRLRGLFCALVQQVFDRAFRRAASEGGRLERPLLVVLDEATNIAPLGDLDGLAATCAGHGVQLVTIWQDLAQVSARYGPRGPTVLNNHRAKLFLSGIADSGTLDLVSQLLGDEQLVVPADTWDRAGGHSTTASPTTRRLLPPDELRRMPVGSGVLVYGALPPVLLALRPWWEDPFLAARGARTPSGEGRVARARRRQIQAEPMSGPVTVRSRRPWPAGRAGPKR